jgi:heme A synthase
MSAFAYLEGLLFSAYWSSSIPHQSGTSDPHSLARRFPLNWNKSVRQTHRWLSIAFTVAVIVNIVAVAQKKYSNQLGLLAVFPLALLLVTGLYLFVLPYTAKWRSGRSAD